jgi:hypothetical protein
MTFSNISTWVLRLLAAIILLQTLFFNLQQQKNPCTSFHKLEWSRWAELV